MKNKIKNPVFLIDDMRGERKYRISSGWDFNPGSVPCRENNGMTLISDGNNTTEMVFSRDVSRVEDCTVGLVNVVELKEGNSFFLSLYDGNEAVWKLCVKDGSWFMQDTKLHTENVNGEYCIYTETDLEKGLVIVYIDDVFCGEFSSKAGGLSSLKIGFEPYISGKLEVKSTTCFADYAVCDSCFGIHEGLPFNKWLCDNGELIRSRYFGDNKAVTYKLTAKNNTAESLRTFDAVTGNVCFEIKYHTAGENEKVTFSMLSAGKKVLSVSDNSTDIYADGKIVRKRHKNVWQYLRIEVDTVKGNASVKLNGKKCACFDVDVGCFDGINIEYSGEKSLLFTDVFVYKIPEIPADYVEEPVMPVKKDYITGMNVCSLWRNGHHVGWDAISPFDDVQTYLGNYDEGIPEVADWETKWLAEHGVDFGLYCWYNNEVNAPLFKTGLSHALEDGYFNSKYSNKIKFAILWEALNCARAGEEGFRNHVVPYWMDHFFSDERYMTIDNKVVISVFGYGCLIKDFGSPEDVKRQLDYVREAVKELGYDGAIFIACSGADDMVKACGFDAVHAYSHGHYGYDKEHTKNRIGNGNNETIHVIPTISVGFNEVAWGGKRYPTLKPDDMRELVSWVKDDVLTNVKEDSWKKKTVMFSTWNEYGEGTYMMPSSLHGFGYLDEIRRGFTEEYDHTDVVPTDKQLSRLGYIVPKGHALLKNMQLEKRVSQNSEKVISLDLNPESWTYSAGLELTYENGILKGKSSVFDPQMILKNEFPTDASSVKKIVLRMKADVNGRGDYAYFHYLTDCLGGEKWDMAKSFEAEAMPDKITEFVFDASMCKLWNGKITAFRFDPVGAEGSFEIESMELICDESIPVIRVCGEPFKPSVPAVINDDGVYVPFDHDTAKHFGIYCKWNRITGKLYLEYKGKTLELERDSDIAVVCGKKQKMPKPLGFFDGLPLINLELICSVFGGTFTVDGKYINISR